MSGRAAGRAVRAFAPGRTEIAGNHTDHQGGRVIAAAVDCGIEMILQANGGDRLKVESEGFEPIEFHVGDLAARDGERNTSAALVRGVVAGMRAEGVAVGGFDARVSSTVPAGSGLSSSAAFELALAAGLDAMFAEEPVSGARRVLVAQAAEREWFGKPCGLMDQLAVQLGGIQLIDFGAGGDGLPWSAEALDFDFERAGYALCLVDTHADHSLFTHEYAQVARDMDAVAGFFGASGLAEVGQERFFGRFGEVRAQLGDRAALRGLHYYHEMGLVDARARALRAGDIEAFLEATRRSGASSAQYLQNVSCAGDDVQPAMVALALADFLLGGQGACRIHGGGFGGTIQAYVPVASLEGFAAAMDAHLGHGSCKSFGISGEGAGAQWA